MINQYIQYLVLTKGYSENTARKYETSLRTHTNSAIMQKEYNNTIQ